MSDSENSLQEKPQCLQLWRLCRVGILIHIFGHSPGNINNLARSFPPDCTLRLRHLPLQPYQAALEKRVSKSFALAFHDAEAHWSADAVLHPSSSLTMFPREQLALYIFGGALQVRRSSNDRGPYGSRSVLCFHLPAPFEYLFGVPELASFKSSTSLIFPHLISLECPASQDIFFPASESPFENCGHRSIPRRVACCGVLHAVWHFLLLSLQYFVFLFLGQLYRSFRPHTDWPGRLLDLCGSSIHPFTFFRNPFLSKDLESCRLRSDLTEIDILRFCPYVLGRILRDIVHIHTCLSHHVDVFEWDRECFSI